MLRSKLRNKYLKEKTDDARVRYKKQRNVCVFLLKKAKKNYFENLDLCDVNDNKKFWKTVKPVFANKIKSTNNITLVEKASLITSDKDLSEIFNEFFVNIVPNLGIKSCIYDNVTSTETNAIASIINTYRDHPSIKAIKSYMSTLEKDSFNFTEMTDVKIIKYIKQLDPKKASQSEDIPTKLIKEFQNLFATVIANDFNKCLHGGTFPNKLKIAEVIPVYKKNEPSDKNNYRPISILSNISKVYERHA